MKPNPPRDHMTDTQFYLACMARTLFGILLVVGIGMWGNFRYESANLPTASKLFLESPVFYIINLFRDPNTYRYMVAPLAATIFIILSASSYVRDIYALTQLRKAASYVINSMFALAMPELIIDGGEKKIKKNQVNLIDAIGGPGFVVIQPGNAVLFRKLRRPSSIQIQETYFLDPFETIGQIASLDEQQFERDGVQALSRDGIRVTVKDIHFRFRLFPEIQFGRPMRRTLKDPYPFDEEALWNMAYNLSVTETGLEAWQTSVGRAIVGGITEFINAHDIDYLTAPREAGQDPRKELRRSLFNGPTKIGLRNLGAELLWVDIGHIAIDEELVDSQRTDYLAADWLGNAQTVRAYGAAKRMVYQELGRAEAQAELLIAIAESLQNTDLGNDPAGNLRRVLLVRTAQILESWAPGETKGAEAGKS